MKIVLTQEVGALGARGKPKTLARLVFESDDDFPNSQFANDDNIHLLDGDRIKLTACYYTDTKYLVVTMLHDLKAIFSAMCDWDDVNPVFMVRVKDECEIRVLCEK
jgi:hypothetical protein